MMMAETCTNLWNHPHLERAEGQYHGDDGGTEEFYFKLPNGLEVAVYGGHGGAPPDAPYTIMATLPYHGIIQTPGEDGNMRVYYTEADALEKLKEIENMGQKPKRPAGDAIDRLWDERKPKGRIL